VQQEEATGGFLGQRNQQMVATWYGNGDEGKLEEEELPSAQCHFD